jgi:hypothetical protein
MEPELRVEGSSSQSPEYMLFPHTRQRLLHVSTEVAMWSLFLSAGKMWARTL